ncbi:hypothetical protein CHISP_1959 [Chitinispirillum alkaliphilum]|nr:hypothetical protein CHISP_1959 [Chitinispirillum alkaliphilum]
MLNSELFEFLRESIRVLVVEDNPQSYTLVEAVLENSPLYKIEQAVSSADAAKKFSNSNRLHVCLLDLGMTDIDNDEFYILRRYNTCCPILVFTGSGSPGKGAESVFLGARAVIEKKSPFDTSHFLKTVNHWALMGILNKSYDEKNWTTLSLATKILFEKAPHSVTEWADYIGITDRQLRNLWGCGAKSVLHLFHLYSNALFFYENQFSDTSPCQLNEPLFMKAREYFSSHPDLLQTLLS